MAADSSGEESLFTKHPTKGYHADTEGIIPG
jgi:hypothetical protein